MNEAVAVQPDGGVSPEERRRYIGGSDVAAIVGLSPYKTALDVYADKLGLVPPFAGNAFTRWGKRLEAVIADCYSETTGRELEPGGFIVHPKYPWAAGNLDRRNRAERLVVECKAAGVRQADRWGEPGTDEIPEEYLLQCAWYLMLTEYSVAEIPVLLGGNDFRVYRVERDEELERSLLDAAARFWHDHIEKQVPPEIGAGEATARLLQRIHPEDRLQLIEATEYDDDLARKLQLVRDQADIVEQEKSSIENALKARIGDAAGLKGVNWKITWKKSKDAHGRTVDWEGLARELAAPQGGLAQAEIARHTHDIITKHGSRRFLPTFSKG